MRNRGQKNLEIRPRFAPSVLLLRPERTTIPLRSGPGRNEVPLKGICFRGVLILARDPSDDERKHKDRKWSAEVTEHSDALDLEADIFESDDPAKIAHSLKRSAERSNRRKSAPFRSAMSMLTFYINRAGKNLRPDQKKSTRGRKGRTTPCLWPKRKVNRDVVRRFDVLSG